MSIAWLTDGVGRVATSEAAVITFESHCVTALLRIFEQVRESTQRMELILTIKADSRSPTDDEDARAFLTERSLDCGISAETSESSCRMHQSLLTSW